MTNSKIDKFNTKYRDKYKIYRENLLSEYVKENTPSDEIYFVYGEHSEDKNKVNVDVYQYGESKDIISINKDILVDEIKVNDFLVNDNGRLYRDEEATDILNNELEELVAKLEIEQEEEMKQLRIENHRYIVNEIGMDRIWLFDITHQDEEEREEIEETSISKEILENVEIGDVLIYKEGNYQVVKE